MAGTAAVSALLLAAALAAGGRPQDPSSMEAMASRAAARIKVLQREADSLASRERTLLEDLRKLEVERDLRAEEFTASTLELQRIERELDDTAIRIAGLERAAESQLPGLSARMVELYKVGNGGYLRMLMSVDDLRDMGRAYRFVSGLQGLDRHASPNTSGRSRTFTRRRRRSRPDAARRASRRRPSPAPATRRRRRSRPTRNSSGGSTSGAISRPGSWANWTPHGSDCSARSTTRPTGVHPRPAR